jgi:hypothetical protein
MNYNKIIAIAALGLFASCSSKPDRKKEVEEVKVEFQNKGHELVYEMVQNVGDYSRLARKKDVTYTYTYATSDGKADVSTEKYIFDNELSYGKYAKHERTLADLEGVMEQGYDGNAYWLKIDGEEVADEKALKRVAFNRPTNYYWFTMMQKLLDPGLNYSYLGDITIKNSAYNIVKVSFQSQGDKPTDIYQLYINQETKLVDQFLFTVADFGKMEIPNLMKLQYEKVGGMLIPTKRRYKKSNWNAEVSDDPWINVTWSDIQFNRGLSVKEFAKD